jgi:hypothetical protein
VINPAVDGNTARQPSAPESPDGSMILFLSDRGDGERGVDDDGRGGGL